MAIALHARLVGGTLSEAAPLFTRIGDSVSVPAEISGHAMFVNIMVNGHGPYRVLVDTGCSVTLVSPALAAAVGAIIEDPEERPDVARNGLGDPIQIQHVMLASIELGGARFEGVTAAVTDSFDRMSAIEGHRIDGALGFPLFADLFLGLDFPNHRMLLDRKWPANAPAIQASLTAVERNDVPFVQVTIQGIPVDVMIDTGANQALHLPSEIASALRWKEEPRAGSMFAVVGEVGREGIGRLAGSMSLGELQQVEPTAVISPGTASLGVRSLERFCLIFHQSENRVWLCGADAAPIMPTAERSNGLSVYAAPGGWRIAGVIPGSPAEDAHMAAGSLITQIEHQSAASWTRDQMNQWINSHAEVALVVSDRSGDRALTLPVWDLVP
jgi:predicted aspartyl protease